MPALIQRLIEKIPRIPQEVQIVDGQDSSGPAGPRKNKVAAVKDVQRTGEGLDRRPVEVVPEGLQESTRGADVHMPHVRRGKAPPGLRRSKKISDQDEVVSGRRLGHRRDQSPDIACNASVGVARLVDVEANPHVRAPLIRRPWAILASGWCRSAEEVHLPIGRQQPAAQPRYAFEIVVPLTELSWMSRKRAHCLPKLPAYW